VRASLKNAKLISLDVDRKDRVLLITYRQQGKLGCFALFWSGRLSYFLDAVETELFIPWKGEKRTIRAGTEIAEFFDEVGRKELNVSAQIKEIIPIDTLLEKEQLELTKTVENKKLKSLKIKKQRIEGDLKNASLWKEISDFIKKEEVDLTDNKEFNYKSLNIKFRGVEGHFPKLDKVYTKIKKLRKGEEILRERVRGVEAELKVLESKHAPQKVTDRSKIIKPVWSNGSSHKDKKEKGAKQEQDKEISEFKLIDSGIAFALGKTAHGNDHLRSVWAHKEDLWFHLESGTSAHLIVKTKDINSLGVEGLQVIGSALGDYSKLQGEQIPLIFTQVKNLKGVKGTPGKVIHKKTKHHMIYRDLNWRKKVC
jgi:predicted ribosome quality control (RQC) complex YloA/Tae2 family protein